MEQPKKQWWGYITSKNYLVVKRFYDNPEYIEKSKRQIENSRDCPELYKEVYGPFEANNRVHAEKFVRTQSIELKRRFINLFEDE